MCKKLAFSISLVLLLGRVNYGFVTAYPGWDIFEPTGEWGYRYGPSIIINADDSVDMWCSSPGQGAWDWIRHKRSTDGGHTWGAETVVLTPTAGSADLFSCCDPGVIKFGGYYYIGYTSTTDNGGTDNNVFVARSSSPTGPFIKWNGNGWGGEPQPFIEFTGSPDRFGAGEPSFVVKDGILYVYYTWADVGISQTRVATVSASDPNWPGNITYQGVAINRASGEDSTDVKYIDDRAKFIGIAVANRFNADSYIHVWESTNGLTFTTADEVTDNLQAWAHNAGISGTPEGHLDLNDHNFIAYAYSKDGGVSWGYWHTHLNPICISGTTCVFIVVSPSELNFNGLAGGPNPPSQTLSIHNDGDGTLEWEITEDCSWLETAPGSGSSSGEIDEVTVSVDTVGLGVGFYNCELTISDSSAINNPETVQVGLHVYIEGEIHVPAEYHTIQAAIDVAADGDTVIIEPGTYTGPGNRDIDFKGKTITVRSTDPNDANIVTATVIDRSGTGGGFHFHSGEDEDSVIEGITITGGYTTYGGGIYCENQSSPTISKCSITGNIAAGIDLRYGSNPTIINCAIAGNGTDGIYADGSNPTIIGCTIAENSGTGVNCCAAGAAITDCTIAGNGANGIYSDMSNLTITDCAIAENAGVGLYCYDGSLTITDCTIAGNGAEGIYTDGSNATITNCTIVENVGTGLACSNIGAAITNCTIAGNGGCGIDSWGGGSPTIINCTVVENAGIGISSHYNREITTISNCIVWDNWPEQIAEDHAPTSATYSNIQDSWSGIGNIDADPCFVEKGCWVDVNDANIIVEPNDPNAVWIEGDYHLKSEGWSWDTDGKVWTRNDVTSRCIDAGNPGSPLGEELLSVPDDPSNEWGENLRINMGAYGGTEQAGMPPYDWAILGDLTNDGIVDFVDLAHWVENWLITGDEWPGDLDRNGIVDTADFALLAQDWFVETIWYEP